MRQADHCHFSGHHRIWRSGHFFERLEQHLPHPRHDPHRQFVSHGLSACAFIWADGGIICRVWCDFDNADPVGDFGKVPQDRQRISPVGVLGAKFGEGVRRIPA